MELEFIQTVRAELEQLIGQPTDPNFRDRLSAVLIVLNHRDLILEKLEYDKSILQNQILSDAAIKFLLPSRHTRRRAQDVLVLHFTQVIFKMRKVCEPEDLPLAIPFGRDMVRWALFEYASIQNGYLKVKAHDEISPTLKWSVIDNMLALGLWKIKALLPLIKDDPEFSSLRSVIWQLMYESLPDFWQRYANLHAIETPLASFQETITGAPNNNRDKPKKIRVGAWSHKFGDCTPSAPMRQNWGGE